MQTPMWAPASVHSASRGRSADAEDLPSAGAGERLLDSLVRTGAVLQSAVAALIGLIGSTWT